MAIYLDANVLWSWRTFTEVERLAVSIVARQLGQGVFVPSIAAREAEEDYRRSLENALADVEQARTTVERRFDMEVELLLEPWPDVDGKVETWRRRLSELATILPLHDEDAHAALDREITGTPPARSREPHKPGRGGRDAAIWLTIARHHAASAEEGHFLTKDRGDFSDGDDQLHPSLRADLGVTSHQMRLYPSVTTFLARLGTTMAGREITLEELAHRAGPAVKEGLKTSLEIPLAVWDELKPELRYSTEILAARPVEVLEQRRYVQGDDAVVVVNARWELTVDCCYQERDTTTPQLWTAIQQIDVTGNAQVFLEEHNGELRHAQLIGAQITSDTSIVLHADGSVISMTSLRDEA